MQIKSSVQVVLFSVVILGWANVFAQQADVPAIKTDFQRIDVNHDGYISSDEMESDRVKIFNEFDKDQNGLLDKEELKADAKGVFRQADKDQNGAVTRESAASQFKKYFQDLDADKDNKISEIEYTDYWKARIAF